MFMLTNQRQLGETQMVGNWYWTRQKALMPSLTHCPEVVSSVFFKRKDYLNPNQFITPPLALATPKKSKGSTVLSSTLEKKKGWEEPPAIPASERRGDHQVLSRLKHK